MSIDKTEMSTLALPVSQRDHIQGPEAAAVTLVQYGDYECPYCGKAYPIVKEIQRRLGNRLRFVFRHFPLSHMHPHAEHAAEAAETAAVQDKFWPMHDALYERQRALADAHLVQYAFDLSLDVATFKREMAEHTHANRVREDFLSGVRSGVSSTPTFFINGLRHDDSYDLETLLAAIEATKAL